MDYIKTNKFQYKKIPQKKETDRKPIRYSIEEMLGNE